MPSSKHSDGPTGHTSGLDTPGLAGFQDLKRLIFHDDGKELFKPGYEVSKRAEMEIKVSFEMLRHFVNYTTEDLEYGVKVQNDCYAMNGLAARLYTGARVAQDRPRALTLWVKVSRVAIPKGATVNSDDEDARDRAHVKADAYAYLCAHCLHDYEKSNALVDLAQASLCAEAAAKLGLNTACMRITVDSFYKRRTEKPTRIETDKTFSMSGEWRFTLEEVPAMNAIMECETIINAATWAEFEAPVEEPAPEVYTCSRPGCSVSTTTRSELRRCAGLCSIDIKPPYCSKQCQKEDWKRHRPQCARPTEQDRSIQFKQFDTGELIDVDTSQLSSVELALAKEVDRLSAYKDNSELFGGPKGKEIYEFVREMEETAYGGLKTAEVFLKRTKYLQKYYAENGLHRFKGPTPNPTPAPS